MSSRSSRTTLPSEAEMTQELANVMPELAGFVAAMAAFEMQGTLMGTIGT